MNLRRILLLLGLPVVLGLERLGQYGARSMMTRFFSGSTDAGGLGMTTVESVALYTRFSGWTIWAPLLGGVVAMLLGAEVSLVTGLALTACGFVALAGASSADAALTALALVTVGMGLSRPSIYALLGSALSRPYEAHRNAGAAGLYLAINVAAFLGSLSFSTLYDTTRSFPAVFLASAVLAGTAVMLGSLAVALGWKYRREEVEPEPWSALPGTGVWVLLALPVSLAAGPVTNLLFDAQRSLHGAGSALVMSLNPMASTLTATALVVLGIILVGTRSAAHSAPLLALGLLGSSAGAMVSLAFSQSEGLLAGRALGQFVFAAGETVVWAYTYSRVGADVHPRLRTLVVAATLVLGMLVSRTGSMFVKPEQQRLVLAVALPLMVVGAVVAWLLRSWLGRSSQPSPAPAPPAS